MSMVALSSLPRLLFSLLFAAAAYSHDVCPRFQVAVYNNVKEDPATGLPTGKHSSMRFKIHDYFTEEGHFDDLRFESHVQVVVKDFQEGVHYTDKAWANVSDKVKKTN